MFNFLEKIYRKFPNGYLKTIIKNIVIFISFIFAQKTKQIFFKNVKFYVYKDRLSPINILLKDISGYTLHYNLKKDDVVVDAGAYNGLFTIYAAKMVGGGGRVIAFEPDPYNSRILTKNVNLNKLKNVTIIKKGLYDIEDTVSFDIQAYGSNIVTNNKNIVTLNSIKTTRLDVQLRKLGIKKVDLIKMDIEGAELKAVRGCVQTIKDNDNIHFAIASYHIVDGKPTYLELLKFFKHIGLKAFIDYKYHLTTYASKH